MSATSSNKKRKLGPGSGPKSRRASSKKFKLDAYHSESDDDQVTARDAPVSDYKSTRSISDTNQTPVAVPGLKVSANQLPKTSSGKPAQAKKARHIRDANSEESLKEVEEVDGDDNSERSESDGVEADSEGSFDSETGSNPRAKTKRRDPAAFATSISAILGSSLSRNKRVDPVLSRSKDAADVSKAIVESKLELKAKKQVITERRLAKEKGRVKDVLIGDRKTTIEAGDEINPQDTGSTAAEILSKEKQLRKLAQRGVVKLFNAVRAAQVRGEEEARNVKAQGVIGMSKREDKVKEMSRSAFLDLVGAGGEKG